MTDWNPNTRDYCVQCPSYECRAQYIYELDLRPETRKCKHLERCGVLYKRLTKHVEHTTHQGATPSHKLQVCGKMVVTVHYHVGRQKWIVEWLFNGTGGTLAFKDTEREALLIASLFTDADGPGIELPDEENQVALAEVHTSA